MKHTITVSKCCGAECKFIKIQLPEPDIIARCTKCGNTCIIETITLTPDSEIAEVLKDKIFTKEELKEGSEMMAYVNAVVRSIAEQLKIPLK